MRWQTAKVVDLLKAPGWKLNVSSPGGDYDTDVINVTSRGGKGSLDICGFDPEHTCKNPSDAEVSMVEVTDGEDSCGGLNSKDPILCVTYGQVCFRLRQHGFKVVPNMNNYF
jgi:hypothetical protein